MPRDKFAALASRAAGSSSTTLPSGQGPAQQSTANPNQMTPVPSPSGRQDKLAALASRAATSSGSPGGRGNKLAAMEGRGNKLAAMAARSGGSANATTESTKPSEEDLEKKKRLAKIKDQLSKRQKILKNLDRAEELTCKLLKIAHQTATSLQDFSSSTDITELSKSYRSTLQELHPLLSTDTQDLIHPYQNHTNETKQSMYGARVEMRLARERTEVLKAFTELERSQRDGHHEAVNITKKRPREEPNSIIS